MWGGKRPGSGRNKLTADKKWNDYKKEGAKRKLAEASKSSGNLVKMFKRQSERNGAEKDSSKNVKDGEKNKFSRPVTSVEGVENPQEDKTAALGFTESNSKVDVKKTCQLGQYSPVATKLPNPSESNKVEASSTGSDAEGWFDKLSSSLSVPTVTMPSSNMLDSLSTGQGKVFNNPATDSEVSTNTYNVGSISNVSSGLASLDKKFKPPPPILEQT